MVTEKEHILKVIQNKDIQYINIDILNNYIKQYPYFQTLWTLKTKWLKQKDAYTGSVLQQTAARTIDRKVLYEFIELKKKTNEPAKEDLTKISNVKKTVHSKKTEKTEQQKTQNHKKNKPSEHTNIIKRNYIEWLKAYKDKKLPKKETKNIQEDLVEKFLKERPKIVPKKNVTVKPPDIIEKSVTEKQMLMTETLANLYVKQKKYDKAIQAFRILSLKNPKKSSYFANQIKEIKQNLK